MTVGPESHPLSPAGARRLVPGLVLLLALLALAKGPEILDRLRTLEGKGSETALVCSYRARTGQPCVGCGGTRAFRLTADGDWRRGFGTNVLGASTAMAAWLLAAASAWSALRGRPRPLLASALSSAGALFVILLVQVALFFWGASAGLAGRAAAS